MIGFVKRKVQCELGGASQPVTNLSEFCDTNKFAEVISTKVRDQDVTNLMTKKPITTLF